MCGFVCGFANCLSMPQLGGTNASKSASYVTSTTLFGKVKWLSGDKKIKQSSKGTFSWTQGKSKDVAHIGHIFAKGRTPPQNFLITDKYTTCNMLPNFTLFWLLMSTHYTWNLFACLLTDHLISSYPLTSNQTLSVQSGSQSVRSLQKTCMKAAKISPIELSASSPRATIMRNVSFWTTTGCTNT